MNSQRDPKFIIEQLQSKIQNLEEQVKKLVAGELNQYDLQSRLDIQLKSQAELVILSRELQGSMDEREIGCLIVQSLVESFDYEKAVLCINHGTEEKPSVYGLDGYYTEKEKKEVMESESELAEISDAIKTDIDFTTKIETPMTRQIIGMDERVIIPLTSSKGDMIGFIVFGNSKQRAVFHHKIDPIDQTVWKTVGGLAASAMENYHLHRQLGLEQESLRTALENHKKLNEKLEGMISERTKELTESKDKYRNLYLESRRIGRLYRTLLDVSPDPIVVYDINRRPTYANLAFTRVFGWTFSEFEEESIDTIPAGNRQDIDSMFEKVLNEKNIFNLKSKRYTKDGHEIDVNISGAAFLDREGKVAGSVIHMRDVTEHNRMEEELLKVRKLETVGLLAGGIAHDFNNILSGILMSSQLGKMNLNQNSNASQYFNSIEEATHKAVSLTNQLLTFAKGGSPIMTITSIGGLISDSANFVLHGSNVKSEFEIDDELLPVEVDDGQISQVIHNIIINAIQSMPHGGKIRIKALNFRASPEDNEQGLLPTRNDGYVKISIHDNGIGIPKENLQKIFDPFFTTKKDGSGLGLTTTFSIIRKHNGYITVESENGIGTTFYIYLPASDSIPLKTYNNKVEKHLAEYRHKILIMDDEEMIRELANDILTSLGYEVVLSEDGKHTIELYREAMSNGRPFDAVIMDLTIPGGMGGKEAIKKLMKLDPEVTAIVSSGYSNDPLMANYKEYGFSGVLGKPYRIEELSQLLFSILSKSG